MTLSSFLSPRARRSLFTLCGLLALLSLWACTPSSTPEIKPAEAPIQPITSIEQLGQMLFFDTRLSRNQQQSCASCHSPRTAFVDDRSGAHQGMSLGDDGQSLGDRNAPSAAYASLIPSFHQNAQGLYVGGQFWDGRAARLEDQAVGPPLNPVEMAMPDKRAVIERLGQDPSYHAAFKRFFGDDIWQQTDQAYAAVGSSIAAFERTDLFAPFDSKYDRYLAGTYQPTEQEELGMTLFFSQQFTNCNLCHQLNARPMAAEETFSNYQYHNIGVPANMAARSANGMGAEHRDLGLAEHIEAPENAGKFKVPTLRNVAVTAPYMHNGVFADLRTVVLFYNKYNSRSSKRQINPETGQPWRPPEVPENLSLDELETGPALDDRRIDALVAFMEMLTDKRYESLLGESQNGPETGTSTASD